MNRRATIRIRRDVDEALKDLRTGFLVAWDSGEYQGEVFEFESPAALFRLLTPKRWEFLERLQCEDPQGIRALARLLERDVKRVHEDVHVLLRAGLIEKDETGILFVPFAEIKADFALRGEAA